MAKMLSVYKAAGEAQAMIIKGLLESCGIPSIIRSGVAPSVHVFTINGLGEYTIMVNESDFEEAQHLIVHHSDSTPDATGKPDKPDIEPDQAPRQD